MSRRSTRTQNEWKVEISGLASAAPTSDSTRLGHLRGSLVGKGHRQNRVRLYADAVDQVRDAIGDDAGLAAAGSRQDKHRPVDGLDGFALLRIQFAQVRRQG